MDNPEATRQTVEYLDKLFGPGAGRKHARFLDHIENDCLRETLHRYHAIEANTEHLSVEENYLLGMCVLCAQKSYSTASMFAKTLRHLGVSKEKILEAIARLGMWVGGIAAAEATTHIQKALSEYDKRGVASLDAWFPNSSES